MKTAGEIKESVRRCRLHGGCAGCEYEALETEYLATVSMEEADKCCIDFMLDDVLGVLPPSGSKRAELVPYDVLLRSSGRGWEEAWCAGEDGDADTVDLAPCVWIDGHIMLADGCNADARSERWRERYGRPRGMRIWEGDAPPTEEQRKEAPWAGLPIEDAQKAAASLGAEILAAAEAYKRVSKVFSGLITED